MQTLERPKTPVKRRGRPPKTAIRDEVAEPKLVRKNLLLDPRSLEELRELYGLPSDSAAVRKAIDLILMVKEARELRAWTMEHGGLDDVYERTKGRPRLPRELTDEDVIDIELEDVTCG
jgi:hypothetical protein